MNIIPNHFFRYQFSLKTLFSFFMQNKWLVIISFALCAMVMGVYKYQRRNINDYVKESILLKYPIQPEILESVPVEEGLNPNLNFENYPYLKISDFSHFDLKNVVMNPPKFQDASQKFFENYLTKNRIPPIMNISFELRDTGLMLVHREYVANKDLFYQHQELFHQFTKALEKYWLDYFANLQTQYKKVISHYEKLLEASDQLIKRAEANQHACVNGNGGIGECYYGIFKLMKERSFYERKTYVLNELISRMEAGKISGEFAIETIHVKQGKRFIIYFFLLWGMTLLSFLMLKYILVPELFQLFKRK